MKDTMRQRLSKFAQLDMKILYVILLILVSLPLITTLNLPIVIHPQAREYYATIEKLPAGSVVVYEMDAEAGTWADVRPGAIATLNHLLTKDVKIIFFSITEDGPMLISFVMKKIDQGLLSQKKYGEDYVVFGFVPGRETAIAAFASDMQRTTPKDIYGTLVEQIPIMKRVHNAKDVTLIALVTTTGTIAVRQWGVTWGTPIVSVFLGMSLPELTPFYPMYVKAYIYGLFQAAEYERLIHLPGEGASWVESLSLAFIFLAVLVVLGNIGYFSRRTKKVDERGIRK